MSSFVLLQNEGLFWVCQEFEYGRFRPWHSNGISREAAERLLHDLSDKNYPFSGHCSESKTAETYDVAARIKGNLDALQERSEPPVDDFTLALCLAENFPWDAPRKEIPSGDIDDPEMPF